MLDAAARRLLSRVLAKPARALVRFGITPNQVSISAAILGIGAGALVAGGRVAPGITAWLVSRILDGLDGILARETGQSSAFGGYLDITLDMAAYSAMLLGFAVIHPEAGWAWSAILVGYVLVTTTTLALSSILERQDSSLPANDRALQFTPGFAEAGETSLVYVLFAVIPQWTTPVAWLWAALCGATVVQRTFLAHRLLR